MEVLQTSPLGLLGTAPGLGIIANLALGCQECRGRRSAAPESARLAAKGAERIGRYKTERAPR